jgi:hypothetical protein
MRDEGHQAASYFYDFRNYPFHNAPKRDSCLRKMMKYIPAGDAGKQRFLVQISLQAPFMGTVERQFQE